MKMDAVGPLRSGIPDPYTYQESGPIGSNRSGYGTRISDLIGPTVDESGLTVDENR